MKFKQATKPPNEGKWLDKITLVAFKSTSKDMVN